MLKAILNNTYSLSTGAETDVLLTFQISDIRSVGNTSTSFSKSIVFPGTRDNNLAFENIFDISTDLQEFNPNKKSPIYLEVDGNIIFNGYLQLNRVIINNKTIVGYETTVFNNVNDLFTTAGELTLKDLDLSRFNHEYTLDNIVGSWENFIVEYGNQTGFNLGNGYVYPYVDYGVGRALNSELTSDFFKPHTYVKTILDDIFDKLGFQYESKFFDSQYFKKLIVSPDISALIINDRDLLKASNYTPLEHFSSSANAFGSAKYTAPFPNDSTLGNFDTDGNYDNTTYEWLCPSNAKYRIDTKANVATSFGTPSGGGITTFVVAGEFDYYAYITLERDSVETVLDVNHFPRVYQETFTINDTLAPLVEINVSWEGVLLEGDIIRIKVAQGYKPYQNNLYLMTNILGSGITPRIKFFSVSGGNFRVKTVRHQLLEGNDIDFTKILPDVKIVDFLTSLIKMFNLVFSYNPLDPTRIIIEPRDEFYDNSKILDYSYKLDRNSEMEVIPLADITDSRIKFTYSADNDYYNKDYQDNNADAVYGSYEYVADNDFLINEKVNDVIFSPAILIDEKVGNGQLTGRQLTTVYDITNDGDITFLSSSKPRILFYNGLIDTAEYRIRSNTSPSIFPVQYPFAAAIDSTSNTSEDIQFWYAPNYTQSIYTTNSNLVNKFWYNYLNYLSNPNNKMFVGLFKLTTNDIYNLTLREIIHIDGVNFIINQIVDFDALGTNGLTKIELLKVDNYNSNSEFVGDAGVNINTSNESLFRRRDILVQFDKRNVNTSLISGSNPNSSPESIENSVINGNNNIIGNVNNSLLFGNDNQFIGSNSLLLGNENDFLRAMTNTIVNGNNNIALSRVENSNITGDGNTLDLIRKSTIIGDDNTLTNIKNCVIIGSNITATDKEGEAIITKATVTDMYTSAHIVDALKVDRSISVQIGTSEGVYETGITGTVPIASITNLIINKGIIVGYT